MCTAVSVKSLEHRLPGIGINVISRWDRQSAFGLRIRLAPAFSEQAR